MFSLIDASHFIYCSFTSRSIHYSQRIVEIDLPKVNRGYSGEDFRGNPLSSLCVNRHWGGHNLLWGTNKHPHLSGIGENSHLYRHRHRSNLSGGSDSHENRLLLMLLKSTTSLSDNWVRTKSRSLNLQPFSGTTTVYRICTLRDSLPPNQKYIFFLLPDHSSTVP